MKRILFSLLLAVTAIVQAEPLVVHTCTDEKFFANTQLISLASTQALAAVEKASKKLDMVIDLTKEPWDRCLAEVERDIFDAAFGMAYVGNNKNIAVFPRKPNGDVDESRSMLRINQWLYKLKGKNLKPFNDSLEGMRVGSPTASRAITAEVARLNGTLEVVDTGMDQLILMLASGRIDLIASPLRLHDDPRIEVYSRFLNTYVYLSVSRKFYADNGPAIERMWNEFSKIKSRDQ